MDVWKLPNDHIMDKQNIIRGIFGRIDAGSVPSRYASAMISDINARFIGFLSNIMDDDTIQRWNENLTDESILEEIAEYGFAFYNYLYIGNPGYEWVEEYLSQ